MLDITIYFIFWLKTILSEAVLSDLAKCPGFESDLRYVRK